MRPPVPRDLGTLVLVFVLLVCLLSLGLDLLVPFSVSANRWLIALLALGCILSRL